MSIKNNLQLLTEYRPDFRRWINLCLFAILLSTILRKISDGIPLHELCSYKLPYYLCLLIPLIFLLIQSIYPTLLGWFCFLCVALIYFYIDFSVGIKEVIAFVPHKWDKTIDEGYYLILVKILFFAAEISFLYFLKPRKFTKENENIVVAAR